MKAMSRDDKTAESKEASQIAALSPQRNGENSTGNNQCSRDQASEYHNVMTSSKTSSSDPSLASSNVLPQHTNITAQYSLKTSQSIDFSHAIGLSQACIAANLCWQWRLLSLVAEQQLAVIERLKKKSKCRRMIPSCDLSLASSCEVVHHHHCNNHTEYLSRSGRRRCIHCSSSAEVGICWTPKEQKRRTSSEEGDDHASLWSVDSQRRRCTGSTTHLNESDDASSVTHYHPSSRSRKQVCLRPSINKDHQSSCDPPHLGYWNEVVINCEINHHYENQLVTYLKSLAEKDSSEFPLKKDKQEGELNQQKHPQEFLQDDDSGKCSTIEKKSTSNMESSSTRIIEEQSDKILTTEASQDQPRVKSSEPPRLPRPSFFREVDITPTPLPDWFNSHSTCIMYGCQFLLSQLSYEHEAEVLSYQPPFYEHVSTPSETVASSQTIPASHTVSFQRQRRRIPYNPPQDDSETQVSQHPLERFPFGTYVRIGVIMVVLGFSTEYLMLLGLVAGVHLSGGLDPFLNWLSSIEARLRTSHWLITSRRPLTQILVELQQRRQRRRETAALVEQAQSIFGQLVQRTIADDETPSMRQRNASSSNLISSTGTNPQIQEQTTEDTIITTVEASSDPLVDGSQQPSIIESIATDHVLPSVTAQDETVPISNRPADEVSFLPDNPTMNSTTTTFTPIAVSTVTIGPINISTTNGPNRVTAPPVTAGATTNFVILNAGPVAPSSWLEEWLIPRPILRWLFIRVDWWIRWIYQLVFALLFSLNPSWQPLTAFISEFPLLPALVSAQAVSVISLTDLNRNITAHSLNASNINQNDIQSASPTEGQVINSYSKDKSALQMPRAETREPALQLPDAQSKHVILHSNFYQEGTSGDSCSEKPQNAEGQSDLGIQNDPTEETTPEEVSEEASRRTP